MVSLEATERDCNEPHWNNNYLRMVKFYIFLSFGFCLSPALCTHFLTTILSSSSSLFSPFLENVKLCSWKRLCQSGKNAFISLNAMFTQKLDSQNAIFYFSNDLFLNNQMNTFLKIAFTRYAFWKVLLFKNSFQKYYYSWALSKTHHQLGICSFAFQISY